MQAALLHGVLRLDECHSPIIICDQPPWLFRSPQTPWHAHTHSIQRVNGLLKDTCLEGESSRKIPGNFLVICMDHINDNLRPCCLLGLVVGS